MKEALYCLGGRVDYEGRKSEDLEIIDSRVGCGAKEVGQPWGRQHKELKEEKYAARRAVLPLLQAEEDERFVNEWKKALEEESRIMKDVPGWKVGESVYHSGRWMPPATGELRPDNRADAFSRDEALGAGQRTNGKTTVEVSSATFEASWLLVETVTEMTKLAGSGLGKRPSADRVMAAATKQTTLVIGRSVDEAMAARTGTDSQGKKLGKPTKWRRWERNRPPRAPVEHMTLEHARDDSRSEVCNLRS
ncbi:hypothetical protein ACLOJK_009654 [Asimina triloba]